MPFSLMTRVCRRRRVMLALMEWRSSRESPLLIPRMSQNVRSARSHTSRLRYPRWWKCGNVRAVEVKWSKSCAEVGLAEHTHNFFFFACECHSRLFVRAAHSGVLTMTARGTESLQPRSCWSSILHHSESTVRGHKPAHTVQTLSQEVVLKV